MCDVQAKDVLNACAVCLQIHQKPYLIRFCNDVRGVQRNVCTGFLRRVRRVELVSQQTLCISTAPEGRNTATDSNEGDAGEGPSPDETGSVTDEKLMMYLKILDHDSVELIGSPRSQEHRIDQTEECALCLDPLSTEQCAQLKLCKHVFHLSCALEALRQTSRYLNEESQAPKSADFL